MENPGDTRGFFCLVLHVRLRYKCRLIHWVPTKLALLNYGLIQMARWVTHSKDRTLLIPEAIYGEPDPGGMTVTPPEVLVARVEGCRHRWGSDSLGAEPSIKAMSSRKVGLAYASDLSVVSSLILGANHPLERRGATIGSHDKWGRISPTKQEVPFFSQLRTYY